MAGPVLRALHTFCLILPHNSQISSTIMILILQIRKFIYRTFKKLTQSYMSTKWQMLDWTQNSQHTSTLTKPLHYIYKIEPKNPFRM